MKTHELKVRRKIVDFVLKGNSKTKAADKFGVSRCTIYRYLRADEAGDLAPKNKSGAARKVDPDKLKAELKRSPDATLADLAKTFNVHFVTIWHCMKRMGLKVKRAHSVRK